MAYPNGGIEAILSFWLPVTWEMGIAVVIVIIITTRDRGNGRKLRLCARRFSKLGICFATTGSVSVVGPAILGFSARAKSGNFGGRKNLLEVHGAWVCRRGGAVAAGARVYMLPTTWTLVYAVMSWIRYLHGLEDSRNGAVGQWRSKAGFKKIVCCTGPPNVDLNFGKQLAYH